MLAVLNLPLLDLLLATELDEAEETTRLITSEAATPIIDSAIDCVRVALK